MHTYYVHVWLHDLEVLGPMSTQLHHTSEATCQPHDH